MHEDQLVIEKTKSRYSLETRYFRGGGVATFRGSLFSGFIRSQKLLTLLSGRRNFRGVTTTGTLR